MKTQSPPTITLIILVFALLFFSNKNFAQTINLGAAANFVLFTSSGAIGNTGSSIINGNIGTNVGSVTGFETSTISGSIIPPGPITQQAVTDLLSAYNQLMVPLPTTTRASAFGTEIITPGIHVVTAAGSIAGTLTLDGQNLANAIFIFRINGAFSTGAGSVVQLVNGASACNIFWVAEGAISLAASSIMKGNLIAHGAANSLGANCSLEGRLLSTLGALATNVDNAILPVLSCWVGETSTDWNTAANWASGVIPITTLNTVIPANPIYIPVLNSGIGTVKNIIIKSGASLIVTGGKLQIAGDISNSGTFDVSGGTIEMNGSSTQTIPANAFLNNNLQNFIVSNNVTLAGVQNLTGTLSFGKSNSTLNTGDNLTLKSTSASTARVADITNGNLLTGNAIAGKVNIERYISPKRAWRLLAAPISSVNAPTINTAWQEGVGGVSASDPYPGYGTHITGGSSVNGFDQASGSASSLKVYNNISNALIGLPASQGTNIPVTNYPAYFIFIRGNRSTQLSLGSKAPISPTTLRIKGEINTGNVISNINASNFSLIGNPYASAIDFHTLTKVNINDMFYVWDAHINGINGVGGYITASWNGNSYDIAPSSIAVTQYIQSGEAFFVQSTDNTKVGSLTFKESDKSTNVSNFVFKPMTGNASELRVNLLGVNELGIPYLSDGVLTTYNQNNSNLIDNKDAKKFYNIGENICIGRQGNDYVIERRKTIETTDTTFLNLYLLKKQTYKLQFTAAGMDGIGLHAIIKDKYLGIKKDTLLNMEGVTNIFFTVNTDTGSYAPNRFSVVFKQDVVLKPVIFSSVKAYRNLKDIVLNWTIENEVKIKKYTVQTSSDNIYFKDEDSIIANLNNNTTQSYTWLDKYPASGIHYYRIKSTDILGKETYSLTVNVNIKFKVISTGISIYGGNVISNTLIVQLINIEKGMYNLELYSMDGLLTNKKIIEHSGSSQSTYPFIIGNNLAKGKYFLKLSGKAVKFITTFIR